jgi:hypothetical protein
MFHEFFMRHDTADTPGMTPRCTQRVLSIKFDNAVDQSTDTMAVASDVNCQCHNLKYESRIRSTYNKVHTNLFHFCASLSVCAGYMCASCLYDSSG